MARGSSVVQSVMVMMALSIELFCEMELLAVFYEMPNKEVQYVFSKKCDNMQLFLGAVVALSVLYS